MQTFLILGAFCQPQNILPSKLYWGQIAENSYKSIMLTPFNFLEKF